MSRSLYDILGVAKAASDDEIKKAYRKLVRRHHPDVNPGDAAAEERFKEIGAAYDVLGDPERRKLYDEFGEDATKAGFDPEQARAHQRWRAQSQWRGDGRRASTADADAEIFESLFGGRRGGPRRGSDVHAELPTDFRTAALGGVRTLTFGDGATMDVRIPPGVDDGGSIRLRGKGAPGRGGGPAGDLVITLRVEPDPVFRRDGLDLHVDLPITVAEAVRGAEIRVPTLDGQINVKVPPGAQTDQTLRIRNRGIERKDRPRGHLFVRLVVRAPDGAVPDDVLDQLAAAYGTDIRADLQGVSP